MGTSFNQLLLMAPYQPPHDKTNKMTYESSEESIQPGIPPGLISVFIVHPIGG